MKVSDLAMLAHREDPRKRTDEVLAMKNAIARRSSSGLVFPSSWSPEMIQQFIRIHDIPGFPASAYNVNFTT